MAHNSTTPSPSAAADQSFPCEYILAGLLGLVSLFALLQIARICVFRHNLRSFQLAFVLLCFLWTAIRVFFWLNTGHLPFLVHLLVFNLPIVFEFATFFLLIIFFTHQTYRDSWSEQIWNSGVKLRHVVWAVYAFSCIALTTVTVVWALDSCTAGENDNDCDKKTNAAKSNHFFNAGMFVVLVVFFTFYSIKMLQLTRTVDEHAADGRLTRMQSALTLQKHAQYVAMSRLIIMLNVIFISRAVYDFVTYFVPPVQIGGDLGGRKDLPPFGLVLYMLWEVMPTAGVLFFFRSIPPTQLRCRFTCLKRSDSDGSWSPEANKAPLLSDADAPNLASAMPNPSLFENINRYDLDDAAFVPRTIPAVGADGMIVNGSFAYSTSEPRSPSSVPWGRPGASAGERLFYEPNRPPAENISNVPQPSFVANDGRFDCN